VTSSPAADSSIADIWADRVRDYFAAADRWGFGAFVDYFSLGLRFWRGSSGPLEGLGARVIADVSDLSK
jgi:hypothetical protein